MSPHAFRILVLDDQWIADLYKEEPCHLRILLSDLLKITVTCERDVKKNTWTLQTSGESEFTVGWITPDYPSTALEDSTNGLKWRCDKGSPVPINLKNVTMSVGQLGEEQKEAQLIWEGGTPTGFCLTGKNLLQKYDGWVQCFVVSYWPFDRLDDLIGATNGWSRYWNVLVLDNVLFKNELRGCRLTYDTNGSSPFELENQIQLFNYFRRPQVSVNKKVKWIPDRRTQAIIEASGATNWDDVVLNQKLWPRFRLDKKRIAEENEDLAVKEFQDYDQCINGSPKTLKWAEFTQSLADEVNRWHRPPIDSLRDPQGLIGRIAATDYPVFLCGPSGRGKSYLAQAIHDMSDRAHKQLKKINCAAIPKVGNFFESTLFGIVKNALGPGSPAHPGVLKEADGSTLFLDEIHHLDNAAQGALLTFLDDGHYRPLGGKEEHADVRIIAASNEPEITKNTFAGPDGSLLRADLLSRLMFYSIEVRPLSEASRDEIVEIGRSVWADIITKPDQLNPLSSLDPTAIRHISVLKVPDTLFIELHKRLANESDWRDRFDNAGNVRLLKQLLVRAAIDQLGQEELTFSHLEQALATAIFRADPPDQVALELPTIEAVNKALANLAEAARGLDNNKWSHEVLDADLPVVHSILSLWSLNGDIVRDVPNFNKWIDAPHTISFNCSDGKADMLVNIPLGRHSKWHVLVVFAFLRHLEKWSVADWAQGKGAQGKISRICNDRAYSPDCKKRVEEAWDVLGYTLPQNTGGSRQSILPVIQKMWAMPDCLAAIPGPSAKREYTESLLANLRTQIPGRIWDGTWLG